MPTKSQKNRRAAIDQKEQKGIHLAAEVLADPQLQSEASVISLLSGNPATTAAPGEAAETDAAHQTEQPRQGQSAANATREHAHPADSPGEPATDVGHQLDQPGQAPANGAVPQPALPHEQKPDAAEALGQGETMRTDQANLLPIPEADQLDSPSRQSGEAQPTGSDSKPVPSRPDDRTGGAQERAAPNRGQRKGVASEQSSTPSTNAKAVEGTEVVEGEPKKPKYEWQMEAGLDCNFQKLGKLVASLHLALYRHPDGGLLLIEDGQPRRIESAKQLAPLLIDSVRIAVTKNGKYTGEKPADGVLNNMLSSRSFLGNFRIVNDVVTTPIVLPDLTPSQPGFNPGSDILYLGPTGSITSELVKSNIFLGVMDWQSPADRTNAVAAALTVPFRHHFPGGKPLILVTATKSHAGKGTLIEFIRGKTAKAEISYEDKDWPMRRNLHEQLLQKPEIGVINFDNVRTDSSGRGKSIRTSFVESFLTSSENVLSSATSRSKPIRTANKFLVLLNTNEGSLSIDLLNRSLPIRLNPTGDLSDRISRAKTVLGGDIKHEWLPAHRDQIEAELWGMIDRWVKEGKPLDQTVRHPMGPWAQTIGGILMVNGFKDFLANYGDTRSAADPLREALSILAFHAGREPRRAGDIAKIAVRQGLGKILLPHVDGANEAACQRAMGIALSPYVGETFSARTATEKIIYRLNKPQGRFGEEHPHYRYTFQEVGRETVVGDAPNGLVLEEHSASSNFQPPVVSVLDQYEPESI
jgi:hypothetical protein